MEDLLFLAMAQQRLGQAAEARKYLNQAAAWLDNEANGKQLWWNARAELPALRREAEALVAGKVR